MSDVTCISAKPHIAIIDDDPGIRASLGMMAETRNWTFAEFERAVDFLDKAQPADFNCMVIDIRIPDMSGLELFEELTRRAQSGHGYIPPILFLSALRDIPTVVRALKQGAADFIEKHADYKTLLDAISRNLSIDQTARNAHGIHARLLQEISELTIREREVLTEIVSGYLSKQIASHLGISTKTVEAHRLRICQKFNVRTTMELAAKLRDIPPSLWQKS